MNMFLPPEVACNCCAAGQAKGNTPIYKLLVLGILAGAFIAFASHAAISATFGWPAEWAASGLNKVVFAASFTLGLILVIVGGAELFTGNNMFLVIALLNRETTLGKLLRNWIAVFIANFIGSLLIVGIVYYSTFHTAADGALTAYGVKVVSVAQGKMKLTFTEALMRGIGCNWLVCMAVWLAAAAKDVTGKIFGCFFPIYGFVLAGFEHSVANMFFLPMGIVTALSNPEATATALKLSGSADVTSFFTWGHFLAGNLLPVTLGNIIGGGVFVALMYWAAYLRKPKAAAQKDSAAKG